MDTYSYKGISEGKYIEGPTLKNLQFQKLTKFYNNIYSQKNQTARRKQLQFDEHFLK